MEFKGHESQADVLRKLELHPQAYTGEKQSTFMGISSSDHHTLVNAIYIATTALAIGILHLALSLALQTLLDVSIQPVLLKGALPQLAGPHYHSKATSLLASALERLHHVPLGAGIEEGEKVASV